jgi:hypothetical protein
MFHGCNPGPEKRAFYVKTKKIWPSVVAPSYSGKDEEDHGSRPALAKS